MKTSGHIDFEPLILILIIYFYADYYRLAIVSQMRNIANTRESNKVYWPKTHR